LSIGGKPFVMEKVRQGREITYMFSINYLSLSNSIMMDPKSWWNYYCQ